MGLGYDAFVVTVFLDKLSILFCSSRFPSEVLNDFGFDPDAELVNVVKACPIFRSSGRRLMRDNIMMAIVNSAVANTSN